MAREPCSEVDFMNVMNSFAERLEDIDARFRELGRLLALPEVAVDYEQVQKLAKERAGLEDTVKGYRELRDLQSQRDEAQSILDDGDDPEMEALGRRGVGGGVRPDRRIGAGATVGAASS